MKKLSLQYINKSVEWPEMIPALFSNNNIPLNTVEIINWSDYPYRPLVSFRIAYTDSAFLIHYVVNEKHIRGRFTKDNDPVWTDSCCEFFCQPFDDGVYYNLECNCIGTVLLGVGKDRTERELASADITKRIKRWSSLGRQPYDISDTIRRWEVALVVPFSTFWKHEFTPKQVTSVKANFYKCGDELTTPHFLSWNPVKVKSPDFHRPDFFGRLLVKNVVFKY